MSIAIAIAGKNKSKLNKLFVVSDCMCAHCSRDLYCATSDCIWPGIIGNNELQSAINNRN